MEADYINLSRSIRDLIGAREIWKDLFKHVFDKSDNIKLHKLSKTFKKIPQSTVYEDNNNGLKFATITKMFLRTKHILLIYHFF